MKIMQFMNSLDGGGAEAVMMRLHQGFLKKGIQSKIVIFNNHEKYYSDIDDLINLNLKKNALGAKKKIAQLLKNENPTLILSHMCDMNRLFSKIDFDNIFLIVHQSLLYKYNNKTTSYKKFRFKREIKKTYNSHHVITVAKSIKDELTQYFQINPVNITTIYNPFNFKEIRKKALEDINEEEGFILHIGRFENVKRHDILLKAFAQINDKDIKLLMLGDGALKTAVQALAKELNIETRVSFLEWQSNPFKYIKRAKLVVLSSESESLSNVLIESLILHTPIVSTNASGPKEILIDELQPYLANINSVESLTNTIQHALANYPKISESNYGQFSDDKVIRSYVDLQKMPQQKS